MIAESTKGRDTQIEDTILQMSAQAEIDCGKTTAENSLVVSIDLAVAVDIAIITVTYLCTSLILIKALRLCISIQLIELSLCADDALIVPSIEPT